MRIDRMTEPLAIAMWDSSWLRRRYAGGGFEDYGKALDELTERGYNAVRIDAYPHMVAAAPDGTNSERFLDPAGFGFHWYGFAQWGSQWTVYIYPKRDLADFLKKCEERHIYVLLSTWLKPTAEPRNEWLEGPEDLIRVWDETLRFLDEKGCLTQVIGVDVSNEIPFGTCNRWMRDHMREAETPGMHLNEAQKELYTAYYNRVLRSLRERWPGMPFAASQSSAFFHENRELDLTDYGFLDAHLWAEFFGFLKETGYRDAIGQFGANVMIKDKNAGTYWGPRIMPPDIRFEKLNEEIWEAWVKNRAMLTEKLEEGIAFIADKGKRFGIPVGNTEGWGSVMWAEHPMLGWDMIKEAGLIAARLGRKYGYAFNCQSNFCEPQFASLWRDVEYHRKVTGIIRGTQAPAGT